MLSTILSGTIVPWILGVLGLLLLLTLSIVVKSWRDMKRSPYFFLRRQAEERLQTYSLVSLGLLTATAVTTAFAWQTPPDTTARVAVLRNAKPPKEEIRQLVAESPMADLSQEVTASPPLTTSVELVRLQNSESLTTPELPEEYDRFEPRVELKDDTDLGTLSFSTELSDDYEAIEPRDLFAEGVYTLYATFDYEAMEDGMEWAWVWRHDGEVVDGGNELWAYGDEGPGYIYFTPEEGFQMGKYSLEVWVNGELFTQSSVTMNTAALSAGN